MKGKRTTAIVIGAAMAAMPLMTREARAVVRNWNTGAGTFDFNTALHWSPTGTPAAGDDLNIVHNDSLSRTITLGANAAAARLRLGAASGGSVTVNQSANLASMLWLTIGDASGYAGTWNYSAGSSNYATGIWLGDAAGSTGAYNLSGSAAVTITGAAGPGSGLFVGQSGNGTFNQSGGTLAIGTTGPSMNAQMFLGYAAGASGAYGMSDGTINNYAETLVGRFGAGTFTQTGGTHTIGTSTVNRSLYVAYHPGSTGTYTLNGASSNLTVNGNAAVGGWQDQSGGSGVLNVQNGQITVTGTLKVWNSGSSAINLAGGTLTAGAVISGGDGATQRFAFGSGELNITGSSASSFAGHLDVGTAGNASMNQLGGTVSFTGIGGSMSLGSSSGNSANYHLVNGDLNVSVSLQVGHQGSGTFTQSSGNVQAKQLQVGVQFLAPGTYHLDGGTLTLSPLSQQVIGESSPGIFNNTGGAHVANGAGGGLFLGATAPGTYNLSNNGSLTFSKAAGGQDFYVGVSNTGLFAQTGGTVNITADLVVGRNTGGVGTYALSNTAGAGSLTVTGNASIGGSSTTPGGTGTLDVASGSASISGLLKIYNGGVGAGNAVNLSGGSLSVGSLDTSNNSSRFNWTGGTFTVTGVGGLNISNTGPLGPTLTIGAGKQLGGSATIGAGGLLSIDDPARIVPGGTITLDGGTIRSTYATSGGFFVNAPTTFKIGASGIGTVDSSVALRYGGTITADGGTTSNGGAGTLVKSGVGEFRYEGAGTANSTFKKLVVNQGLFRLGSVAGNNFETGFGAAPQSPLADAITLNGGEIGSSYPLTLNANRGITLGPAGGTIRVSANAFTVPGKISGGNALTIIGTQDQATLNNATNQIGDLTVNGLLTLGANHSVGSLSGSSVGVITVNSGVTLTVNQAAPLTFNGRISGAGNFITSGAETLTMVGFDYNNTGATSINVGTLKFGAASAGLGNMSAVTIASGATLDFNSFNDTMGSLAGAGNLINAGNVTVGGNNASTSFSGNLTATGTFTKNGTGTMTISGGTFTIGRLSLPTPSLFAFDGGTIDINDGVANTTIGAALTIGNGSGAVATFKISDNDVSATAINVRSDGQLVFNGGTLSAPSITIAGAPFGGINTPPGDPGALQGGPVVASYSGDIILDGVGTNAGAPDLNQIGVDAGGTLNLTGVINNGLGGYWAKTGPGTLVLGGSSANTYTGLTRIFGGMLVIEKDGALGTAGSNAGTTGNTFQLLDSQSTIAFRAPGASPGLNYSTNEWIFTNGTGNNLLGQVDSLAGDNTFAGSIAFNGPTTSGLVQGEIGMSAGSLTVQGGMFAGVAPVGAREIHKIGAGTLILTGNSATTTNPSSAVLDSASSITLDAGTLKLSGAAFAMDAVKWNINAGAAMESTGGAPHVLSGAVNNAGSVIVLDATLRLSGGGMHTGTFSAATGTVLNFLGGTHAMSAGATIGGGGTVLVSGANVNFAGDLNVPNTLAVNLTAGSLSVSGTTRLGNTSGAADAFQQSDGTHTASTKLVVGAVSGGNATYNLSGGSLTSPEICIGSAANNASIVQTGGTLGATSEFNIGLDDNAISTYDLSGAGILNAAKLRVGIYGSGTVNHSAGTANAAFLIFGEGTGSGTYNLSGTAQLNVSGPSTLGGTHFGPAGGTGTMTIAGGTAAITGSLTLWKPNSAVNLTGGSLSAGTIDIAAGEFSYDGGSLTTSAVNVSGNGLMQLGEGSARVLKSTTLAISGAGKVDLTDNKMIVTGQSVAPVEAKIASGRNGGSWNGVGIVTSQPDALTSLTTLAVAAAGEVGMDSFGGVSVAGSDVLVMYTYAGDADLSGEIDGDDFLRIDASVGTTGAGYSNGDFNYDGLINGDDYFLIDLNYGRQDASFSPGEVLAGAGAMQVQTVPEPAGATILGGALMVLVRRRRRQRVK